MSPKTLPRFDDLDRAPADRLVRPLASPLLELAAASEEGRRQANIGERYSEMRTRISSLGAELQKAEAADAAAETKALEAGKAVPRKKAPALAEELEEARRQLGVLADLLRQTAADLLRAAIPHLPEAIEKAEGDAAQALAEAGDLLEAADAAFVRAADLSAAEGWLYGLSKLGLAPAWRPHRAGVAPRAAAAVRAANHSLER
jgi:hypothetical protein